MHSCRRAIVTLLFSFCAYGQNAPLAKDAVIQMVKAGLPEDVIVSKIRSEANPPKLSTDDLISLKSVGVSDGVLRALVSPSPKTDPPSASGSSIASADADNPMGPHDPMQNVQSETSIRNCSNLYHSSVNLQLARCLPHRLDWLETKFHAV